ncbi:unnamed protein product [Fraxinus pennsylvanica]|uniref:Uncharacterized protein n=1 Tax=Fraxinus pennsylvanica TaxID=56036 RepID=A0AAD1ZDY0_9LAMI|nr:unnamed protein product [Fraxinus pennsylvanica]
MGDFAFFSSSISNVRPPISTTKPHGATIDNVGEDDMEDNNISKELLGSYERLLQRQFQKLRSNDHYAPWTVISFACLCCFFVSRDAFPARPFIIFQHLLHSDSANHQWFSGCNMQHSDVASLMAVLAMYLLVLKKKYLFSSLTVKTFFQWFMALTAAFLSVQFFSMVHPFLIADNRL